MFKYVKFFGATSLDPKFFRKSYSPTPITSISNLILFEVENKSYYLPDNCLYYLWGRIIYRDRYEMIIKTSDGRIFKIYRRGDNFLITCVINGLVIFEFIDYTSNYFDSDSHSFEREIGGYLFEVNSHTIVSVKKL
jgi:hypothetical protein